MNNNKDWADTIITSLLAELEQSILEADQGITITYEEARKQIRDMYNLK